MTNQLTLGFNFGGQEMLLIFLVVFLLFGASRLPQLAKALGQSKRAFREGIDEGEAEAERERLKRASAPAAELTAVDDEALFEEARRRAAARRASEKS